LKLYGKGYHFLKGWAARWWLGSRAVQFFFFFPAPAPPSLSFFCLAALVLEGPQLCASDAGKLPLLLSVPGLFLETTLQEETTPHPPALTFSFFPPYFFSRGRVPVSYPHRGGLLFCAHGRWAIFLSSSLFPPLGRKCALIIPSLRAHPSIVSFFSRRKPDKRRAYRKV